jgi:aspartyl/asparaginyl-tRNA synthetase
MQFQDDFGVPLFQKPTLISCIVMSCSSFIIPPYQLKRDLETCSQVRTVRAQKSLAFLKINDGSTVQEMQGVPGVRVVSGLAQAWVQHQTQLLCCSNVKHIELCT